MLTSHLHLALSLRMSEATPRSWCGEGQLQIYLFSFFFTVANEGADHDPAVCVFVSSHLAMRYCTILHIIVSESSPTDVYQLFPQRCCFSCFSYSWLPRRFQIMYKVLSFLFIYFLLLTRISLLSGTMLSLEYFKASVSCLLQIAR
jgi:hypothetical protein